MTPILKIDFEEDLFPSNIRTPLQETLASNSLSLRTAEAAQANLQAATITFTSSSRELAARASTLILQTSEEINSVEVETSLTYEELLSAVTINGGPYSTLTKEEISVIAENPSAIFPLKEIHLEQAYAKTDFFSPAILQKLDRQAALPKNQAKIEDYFGKFGVKALPHSTATAGPFKRRHLSRAHLLAMCFIIDAFQNQNNLPLSLKEKDSSTSQACHQAFIDSMVEGLKELLSTHIGQILFLRVLQTKAKIFIEKTDDFPKCCCKDEENSPREYTLKLINRRDVEITHNPAGEYHLLEWTFGANLFHELFHVLQLEAVENWPNDLSQNLKRYNDPSELFTIAPVFSEELWFCESGFFLETNKIQRDTHDYQNLESLMLFAKDSFDRQDYKTIATLLKSDLYLNGFGFAPEEKMRGFMVSAILLHPEFASWLDRNPTEKESLLSNLGASALNPFVIQTRKELLSSLRKEPLTSTSRQIYRFLAPFLSKEDFEFLSYFIDNYNTDKAISFSIACFIEEQAAKDWIKEHPLEQAFLSLLAEKDKSKKTAVDNIRKIFPLDWDLFKSLIERQNTTAIFHLLTAGERYLIYFFYKEENIQFFLNSESFKELFKNPEKKLYYPFFLITLTSIVSSCLSQNCDNFLWMLAKDLLQDAEFLSFFLEKPAKSDPFIQLLLTHLGSENSFLKIFSCISSLLAHPAARERFSTLLSSESRELLNTALLKHPENEDAQKIFNALFSQESSRKGKRKAESPLIEEPSSPLLKRNRPETDQE